MLFKQVNNPTKVRNKLRKIKTENLKFWTDLQEQFMDGWPVTQEMIIFQRQIAKKSLHQNQASPVSAGLYIALKHCISFVTVLALNFGSYQFRIMPVLDFVYFSCELPRWVSFCPDGVSFCRIPPPTPVLYSAVTHSFRGCVCTQHTQTPPQNTPFPGLNLKVGKINNLLGKMDSNWAKCLKSGKMLLEVGKTVYSSWVCPVGHVPIPMPWKAFQNGTLPLAGASDITRFSPWIDWIFSGEALNSIFGAKDERFLEFRSK